MNLKRKFLTSSLEKWSACKFWCGYQLANCFDVLDLQLELSIDSVGKKNAKRAQVLPGEGKGGVLHVASVGHKEISKIEL